MRLQELTDDDVGIETDELRVGADVGTAENA